MTVLEGKAALVTGSGRGIGAATARKLSEAGARVIINDLDSEVAEEVANSFFFMRQREQYHTHTTEEALYHMLCTSAIGEATVNRLIVTLARMTD